MKTAKEYWVERFGKPPQNEEEKWAITMMAEYAEYCFNESKKIITGQPYRCPVCNGNGLVPRGFYNGAIMTGYWSSADTASETCRSCNGSGVVNF
jgi:DnaJ-class molecular chaperone